MKIFITIWSGQLVSRIGTAMTRFALLIWAYQQTGDATTVALLGFFSFLPLVAISPIAGVWVDRLDRRNIMLLADLGVGLTTTALLTLYAAGQLHIWHLYLAEALAGVFEAFQGPAYSAATSILLPKSQYTRANGLRSLAEFSSQVAAPILGGLLLGWIGIAAVMVVDLVTFLVALATLLVIRRPLVAGTSKTINQSAFWQEVRMGFPFIWRQPGLLGRAAFSRSATW